MVTAIMSLQQVSVAQLPYRRYKRLRNDTLTTSDGVDIYLRNIRSFDLKMLFAARIIDAESSPLDPLRVSTGISADYFLPRWGSFSADVRGAWFSYLQQQATTENLSQNALNPFLVANVGGRAHFLDGKGDIFRRITLGIYHDINDDGSPHTTVRYIRMPFPCKRISAVRAGWYYSRMPVSANINKDVIDPEEKGSVRTADGSVFTGNYHTNVTNNGFYLGFTRIINMHLHVSSNIDTFEGQTRKKIGFYKEFYADVIVANTQFDPFRVAGNDYHIKPNDAGSFKTSNIGWRVGGRTTSNKQHMSLGLFYEIGGRPGIFPYSLYAGGGLILTYLK